MKARPKACSTCNKTFWTKLDHEIRCPRCSRKLLAKRTAHVLSKPLPKLAEWETHKGVRVTVYDGPNDPKS